MTHGAVQEARARQVLLARAQEFDGRSPIYANLCRRLVSDNRAHELVDDWTWDAPLRLLAGLHYLVLTGQANWRSIDDTLVEHDDFLRAFVRGHTVQTNEVQRSWILIPCFGMVAKLYGASSADFVELGASAGLNLCWDGFAAHYQERVVGDTHAAVQLRGDERVAIPRSVLDCVPAVATRTGVDLHPLDAGRAEDVLHLKSFVWPGDPDRVALLEAAAHIARTMHPELRRGHVTDVVGEILAARDPRRLTIVFETAMLPYLGRTESLNLLSILDSFGSLGNLALICAHAAGDGPSLSFAMRATIWPSGSALTLAIADIHGNWLEWKAQ